MLETATMPAVVRRVSIRCSLRPSMKSVSRSLSLPGSCSGSATLRSKVRGHVFSSSPVGSVRCHYRWPSLGCRSVGFHPHFPCFPCFLLPGSFPHSVPSFHSCSAVNRNCISSDLCRQRLPHRPKPVFKNSAKNRSRPIFSRRNVVILHTYPLRGQYRPLIEFKGLITSIIALTRDSYRHNTSSTI